MNADEVAAAKAAAAEEARVGAARDEARKQAAADARERKAEAAAAAEDAGAVGPAVAVGGTRRGGRLEDDDDDDDDDEEDYDEEEDEDYEGDLPDDDEGADGGADRDGDGEGAGGGAAGGGEPAAAGAPAVPATPEIPWAERRRREIEAKKGLEAGALSKRKKKAPKLKPQLMDTLLASAPLPTADVEGPGGPGGAAASTKVKPVPVWKMDRSAMVAFEQQWATEVAKACCLPVEAVMVDEIRRLPPDDPKLLRLLGEEQRLDAARRGGETDTAAAVAVVGAAADADAPAPFGAARMAIFDLANASTRVDGPGVSTGTWQAQAPVITASNAAHAFDPFSDRDARAERVWKLQLRGDRFVSDAERLAMETPPPAAEAFRLKLLQLVAAAKTQLQEQLKEARADFADRRQYLMKELAEAFDDYHQEYELWSKGLGRGGAVAGTKAGEKAVKGSGGAAAVTVTGAGGGVGGDVGEAAVAATPAADPLALTQAPAAADAAGADRGTGAPPAPGATQTLSLVPAPGPGPDPAPLAPTQPAVTPGKPANPAPAAATAAFGCFPLAGAGAGAGAKKAPSSTTATAVLDPAGGVIGCEISFTVIVSEEHRAVLNLPDLEAVDIPLLLAKQMLEDESTLKAGAFTRHIVDIRYRPAHNRRTFERWTDYWVHCLHPTYFGRTVAKEVAGIATKKPVSQFIVDAINPPPEEEDQATATESFLKAMLQAELDRKKNRGDDGTASGPQKVLFVLSCVCCHVSRAVRVCLLTVGY